MTDRSQETNALNPFVGSEVGFTREGVEVLHQDLHNLFQTGVRRAGHLLDRGVGYGVLIDGSHEGSLKIRAAFSLA